MNKQKAEDEKTREMYRRMLGTDDAPEKLVVQTKVSIILCI